MARGDSRKGPGNITEVDFGQGMGTEVEGPPEHILEQGQALLSALDRLYNEDFEHRVPVTFQANGELSERTLSERDQSALLGDRGVRILNILGQLGELRTQHGYEIPENFRE